MIPYDSNSHSASNFHKKAASDLKTQPLHSPCSNVMEKQPTKFLGLCTFKSGGGG